MNQCAAADPNGGTCSQTSVEKAMRRPRFRRFHMHSKHSIKSTRAMQAGLSRFGGERHLGTSALTLTWEGGRKAAPAVIFRRERGREIFYSINSATTLRI